MSKSTLKNRFFGKQLKIEQNTARIEVDFEKYSTHNFDFRLRWTRFKIGETSVQISAVAKLTVSL